MLMLMLMSLPVYTAYVYAWFYHLKLTIGHRKEIRKLTFQALALRRSESRNCGLCVAYLTDIYRVPKAAGEFRLPPFSCLFLYSRGFILELIALAYVTFLVLMQRVWTLLMFMLVLMVMS